LPDNHIPVQRSADVELLDVLGLLWFGRYVLVRFVVLFAIIGVVVSLRLPNQYRSEAIMKPVASEPGSLMGGGLLSQVGALAGVNLDLTGRDNATLAVETLKSRPFLVSFAHRRGLVPALMAGTRWDPQSGQLMLNAEMYDQRQRRWLRAPKPPRTSVPTDDEIYDRFRSILSVDLDAETGLVRISVTFFSPELAQGWLTAMIADLNEGLRRREIDIRERSIEYLTEKIKLNQISTLDDDLADLLKSEIRDHMLAEVRKEYALETVAAPYRPLMKSGPNRALICAVAVLVGGIIGAFYLLVRHARRPYRERPPLVPLRWMRTTLAGIRPGR
jgi:uncharacterized protein involved in exopolysaccharide biosynthesis